jgi:hypothetical protein
MSKGNSPAFPCQDSKKNIYTGMNLRDYFALEAMHALIEGGGGLADNLGDVTEIAQTSYRIADAMLDERLNYK